MRSSMHFQSQCSLKKEICNQMMQINTFTVQQYIAKVTCLTSEFKKIAGLSMGPRPGVPCWSRTPYMQLCRWRPPSRSSWSWRGTPPRLGGARGAPAERSAGPTPSRLAPEVAAAQADHKPRLQSNGHPLRRYPHGRSPNHTLRRSRTPTWRQRRPGAGAAGATTLQHV